MIFFVHSLTLLSAFNLYSVSLFLKFLFRSVNFPFSHSYALIISRSSNFRRMSLSNYQKLKKLEQNDLPKGPLNRFMSVLVDL